MLSPKRRRSLSQMLALGTFVICLAAFSGNSMTALISNLTLGRLAAAPPAVPLFRFLRIDIH